MGRVHDQVILVDDRVGSKHLTRPLRLMGLPTTVTRLEFGDAAFSGHGPAGPVAVGIELKTLDDLIGSLTSKRFQAHQLPGMLQSYQWPCLIVQGEYREAADGLIEKGVQYGHRMNWFRHPSPMTYQRLEGTLLTLTFATGFRVFNTRDEISTARLVAHLYRWWSKPWSGHQSHKVMAQAEGTGAVLTDPWFNRARHFSELVALQVPGLGQKRATAAARHFGSVRAMGLPSGIALIGLTVSVSGLSLITYLVDIPSFAPVVGAMVGGLPAGYAVSTSAATTYDVAAGAANTSCVVSETASTTTTNFTAIGIS